MGWYAVAVLAVVLLVGAYPASRLFWGWVFRRRGLVGLRLGNEGQAEKDERIRELYAWAEKQHRVTHDIQELLDQALIVLKDNEVWHKTFREQMKGLEARIDTLEKKKGP